MFHPVPETAERPKTLMTSQSFTVGIGSYCWGAFIVPCLPSKQLNFSFICPQHILPVGLWNIPVIVQWDSSVFLSGVPSPTPFLFYLPQYFNPPHLSEDSRKSSNSADLSTSIAFLSDHGHTNIKSFRDTFMILSSVMQVNNSYLWVF